MTNPPRRPGWRSYLQLLHPGPSALCTAFTLAAGVGTAGSRSERLRRRWPRLLMAGLAMACAQTSTGVLNDAADFDADREQQPYKPIVRGEVSPERAWAVGVGLGAASLLAAGAAGAGSLRLMALGLGCGWAYDLRLSRTPFSFVPFAVGLATVPRLGAAAVGLERPRPRRETVLVVALSLALHLANAAPDVERDRQAGRRSLPVLLGVASSRRLSRLLLLLSAPMVALSATPGCRRTGWAGSLAAVGLALVNPGARESGDRPFVAPALAGGCLAAGWLLSDGGASTDRS